MGKDEHEVLAMAPDEYARHCAMRFIQEENEDKRAKNPRHKPGANRPSRPRNKRARPKRSRNRQ